MQHTARNNLITSFGVRDAAGLDTHIRTRRRHDLVDMCCEPLLTKTIDRSRHELSSPNRSIDRPFPAVDVGVASVESPMRDGE